VFWFLQFRQHADVDSNQQLAARWIDVGNNRRHPLNSMFLRAIATALKASGIPSYVYLAQVNSSWLATDPALSRSLAGVERQLAGFRSAFDARNIRFQPKSVSRLVPGLRFLPGDPVHINDPAGLGPYVARQLCLVQAQAGKAGPCVPTTEDSTHG
jgi:hypothetical protein